MIYDNYFNGPVTAFQPTIDATCVIRENHIIYMSYFMTTILINSPTNIFLSDLRGGEIINRGSFGYIFKPNNDKNIVIKIVVCIKENKNYVLYLDNEIDIHKKLSLYGDTYFMKLYGYFVKNKKNIYEYKTISDEYKENKIQISTSDNNFLEDACEVYLLEEIIIDNLEKKYYTFTKPIKYS
jgi:hypothetical protein